MEYHLVFQWKIRLRRGRVWPTPSSERWGVTKCDPIICRIFFLQWAIWQGHTEVRRQREDRSRGGGNLLGVWLIYWLCSDRFWLKVEPHDTGLSNNRLHSVALLAGEQLLSTCLFQCLTSFLFFGLHINFYSVFSRHQTGLGLRFTP